MACFLTADNTAVSKPASESAPYENLDATLAVDGHTGPQWNGGHCAIIFDNRIPSDTAWWSVDLQHVFTIYAVTVHSIDGTYMHELICSN